MRTSTTNKAPITGAAGDLLSLDLARLPAAIFGLPAPHLFNDALHELRHACRDLATWGDSMTRFAAGERPLTMTPGDTRAWGAALTSASDRVESAALAVMEAMRHDRGESN